MLEHHIITSLPKETDLMVEAAAEQEAEMLPLQIVIKVTIATHVIHQKPAQKQVPETMFGIARCRIADNTS